MDNQQLVEMWLNQEQYHSLEGKRGVLALCKLAQVLGYKDPMYFGQLDTNASIGDLVMMLEDNSGMIEAMFEWIGQLGNPDFNKKLSDAIQMPGNGVAKHYTDGKCPDCGEDIPMTAIAGEECENCGHVFAEPTPNDDAWNKSDGQGA